MGLGLGVGFIDQLGNALLKQMETAYNSGSKSVLDWIKLHHSDYSAGDIETTLKEGNPSAAAFMKMQAFTTAAVQDQRIRTRIQAALAGNLKRGEDQADFKKVIDAEFERAGLTKLHPSAIQNIYYTNTSMAFSAGQMQKMVEVSGDFPYWKYSATMDSKTRPDHARLHGKIFRMGDFQFYPPLGFRCRCTAIPLTKRMAESLLSTNRGYLPTDDERQNLKDTLQNAEFMGNKNEKYMKWLAKEYDKADSETQAHIDKAIDELKAEIKTAKTDAVQNLNSGSTVTASKLSSIAADDVSFVVGRKEVQITDLEPKARYKVKRRYLKEKTTVLELEEIKK